MVRFERPSASSMFWALFSGSSGSFRAGSSLRGRLKSCCQVPKGTAYRSAKSFTSPRSTSAAASFSPRPSTSSARRPAKWQSRPTSWAGHAAPVQRHTFSPSSRTTRARQTGHSDGKTKGRSSPVRRSGRGFTTSGITSPARRTRTQSPSRMSLRRISSSLWSVARDTIAPESRTGSKSTTGVRIPVRPTDAQIRRIRVASSCGGYLKAAAQRGDLDAAPSRRRQSRSSTFTTMPSVS